MTLEYVLEDLEAGLHNLRMFQIETHDWVGQDWKGQQQRERIAILERRIGEIKGQIAARDTK